MSELYDDKDFVNSNMENNTEQNKKKNTNILKIFIDDNYPELKELYVKRINDHNNSIMNSHPDAGFDIITPKTYHISKQWGNKVGLGIHMSMDMCVKNGDNCNVIPQCYYLYPRSSISKTPIRLSNNVGIIDSGYRGEIAAMVDFIDFERGIYTIDKHSRYFQICSPTLEPIFVMMVQKKEDLGITLRGDGGFGSTGK
jgi:dUTPase